MVDLQELRSGALSLYKTSQLNEEVYCNEPFPSARVPCLLASIFSIVLYFPFRQGGAKLYKAKNTFQGKNALAYFCVINDECYFVDALVKQTSGQSYKTFYGRNYVASSVTQSKSEKYAASGVIMAVKSL